MKKILTSAAVVGALFVVTGCVSGEVNDKRAPGYPGEKTYQIQLDNDKPVGPDKLWVTVPEKVWEQCHIGERYPEDCGG